MEDMDHYYYRDHSGQRATGIGLAAGLGGAAIFGSVLGLLFLNQASKARFGGAMAGIAGNTAALGSINNNVLANRQAIETSLAAERVSRENWQSANQPSIQSYIDVQATPTAQSTSSAIAEALAFAQAVNGGINPAIATDSYVKVASVSGSQPCGCNGCGC